MAGLQAWTDRPNTLQRCSDGITYPPPRLSRLCRERREQHPTILQKKQSRFNKPLFQIYQRLPPISVKLIASAPCSRAQNLAASNDYINIKKEG